MTTKKNYTAQDAQKALERFIEVTGRKDRAQEIERVWRLETLHFKSLQFKLTGSAGMEKGKWAFLDEDKMATIQMADNHLEGDKKMRTFLVWDDLFDFCMYLSNYIDRYDGNVGRWNSMNPAKQKKYADKLKTIKVRFAA